jgi:heme exporter protein D
MASGPIGTLAALLSRAVLMAGLRAAVLLIERLLDQVAILDDVRRSRCRSERRVV